MTLAGPSDNGGNTEAWESVRTAARAHDFDRYLAALLAPRDVRRDLVTLAAFHGEAARIPRLVSEPMQGEIRFQWWRDALTADAAMRSGSPVADALNETIERRGLSRETFNRVLDARAMDLYPEAPADEGALFEHLDDTEGAAFRLAARVLGDTDADGANRLARTAGVAFGLMRALSDLPAFLARGRMPLPRSWLGVAAELHARDVDALANAPAVKAALAHARAEARRHLADSRPHVRVLPRRIRAAFLPLALVEPYLRALERPDHDPLRQLADLPPLTRVWRLWRAHLTGSV